MATTITLSAARSKFPKVQLSLSYPLTQLGEATEIPTSDIDKSLDLEKFLKRNYSNFYFSIAEANFHVSFSSRFSRNGGKVSLSPLYFQDSRKFFLSHLDFQDCGDQFLCILSIFKIFSLNILIINNFPLRKPTRSCFGLILILIWSYFDKH